MPISRRNLLRLVAALGAREAPAQTKSFAGRKLFIVPYSHIDWAWTHTRQWQAERAAQVVAEALDILRAQPEYRFFVDTWNEQVEAFLDRCPDRVNEFRQAVESGKMAVCGGSIANQHPSWMESESLIRDIVLGRRKFRQVLPRFQPQVMVKFDVTAGPAQMPQILRKAGYWAYRFDRPDEGYTAEGVPRNLIWQGLDGTEILASRGHYTGIRSAASLGDFRNSWAAAAAGFYEKEVTPAAEPRGGNCVWLPMGSDDVRPLRSAVPAGDGQDGLIPLAEFIRLWNRNEPSPLAYATPVEFFEALRRESATLPRRSGVLESTLWTYLYGLNGNNGLRTWRTRADRALVSAEMWSSCLPPAETPYPAKELEDRWLELLSASSHAQNWLFEEDYAAQSRKVRTVVFTAESLRDRAIRNIAARVRQKREERPYVLLFNDLPWDRTEVVRIWASMPPGGASNVVARDSHENVIPHQVVQANRYPGPAGKTRYKEFVLLIRARVPALGYTTVFLDPADGPLQQPEPFSSGGVLDTEFASMEFSEGGIEALLDKASGSRYAGAGEIVWAEVNETGPYLYGPIVKTEPMRATRCEISRGPLRSTFRLTGSAGPHAVHLTGHLYPHARRVSFDAQVSSQGGCGYLFAAVGLPRPGRLFADAHFGVEPRDPSRIAYTRPERLLKDVFYGANWADYSYGAAGLALVGTTGEKGYQLVSGWNALRHFLLRVNPPVTKDSWEKFITPARQGEGPQRFDYHLLLHEGDWRRGEVFRRALEIRHPIQPSYRSRRLPATSRSLPAEHSFLQLECPNAQLSAFYRQDGRLLVRIFESSGQPAEGTLVLRQAMSAREVDLHGDALSNGRKFAVSAGRIAFRLKPWEIVTIEIA